MRLSSVNTSLDVEFLEHLHRQRGAVAVEQFERPQLLRRLAGFAADRIQQDIGVEEMQPYLSR
jgi:hypothetical protein